MKILLLNILILFASFGLGFSIGLMGRAIDPEYPTSLIVISGIISVLMVGLLFLIPLYLVSRNG